MKTRKQIIAVISSTVMMYPETSALITLIQAARLLRRPWAENPLYDLTERLYEVQCSLT